MSISYIPYSTVTTQYIKQYGIPCQILYSDGSKSKTFGINIKQSTKDVDSGAAGMVTLTTAEIIISYVTKDPIVGDTLIWNKKEYTIDATDPIKPTDLTIANTLTIRLA
jgi:hypothetical protein